jgi:hypothetical protein
MVRQIGIIFQSKSHFQTLEAAILDYESSKTSLSEAFIEDMSGNIVMQLFSC